MSFTTATTIHSGRRVIWQKRGHRFWDGRFLATLDNISIHVAKLQPTPYLRSRNFGFADPVNRPYRVHVAGQPVEPDRGFRRTLRQAKGDGVAQALRIAREIERNGAKREGWASLRPSILTPGKPHA